MCSVAVACELQSTVSIVVVHGLSCSAAHGIFLDQGSNPWLDLIPCIGIVTLDHQESPPSWTFKMRTVNSMDLDSHIALF